MSGPSLGSLVKVMYTKPVHVYLGLGATLYVYRWYETQTTFNWWFGKFEFERRKERGQI